MKWGIRIYQLWNRQARTVADPDSFVVTGCPDDGKHYGQHSVSLSVLVIKIKKASHDVAVLIPDDEERPSKHVQSQIIARLLKARNERCNMPVLELYQI